LLGSIQPFIGWLGNLNAKINFGSMQQSLIEREALYNRALQVFLQMKTVGDLFINLLIMALLPAIAEELFFRGSLQKAMMRLSISRGWLY
jgi:membrane protease YdiL (CAAX protease family)